jgi:hypothetical protein
MYSDDCCPSKYKPTTAAHNPNATIPLTQPIHVPANVNTHSQALCLSACALNQYWAAKHLSTVLRVITYGMGSVIHHC